MNRKPVDLTEFNAQFRAFGDFSSANMKAGLQEKQSCDVDPHAIDFYTNEARHLVLQVWNLDDSHFEETDSRALERAAQKYGCVECMLISCVVRNRGQTTNSWFLEFDTLLPHTERTVRTLWNELRREV